MGMSKSTEHKVSELQSSLARQNFRAILNEVEHQNTHVKLTRYDNPVAVMVPPEWYELASAAMEYAGLNKHVRAAAE